MNKLLTANIAIVLVALQGAAWAQTVGETTTSEAPPSEPGSARAEPTETKQAVEAGTYKGIVIENPEVLSEGAADQGQTEYSMMTDRSEKTQADNKESARRISGAFGLKLGEPFAPWMVARVIDQKEITYNGRGENKTQYTGIQYQVEPRIPNPLFNQYLLKTNKDGVIYGISAKHAAEGKTSVCAQTRQLAEGLIEKYGRPRGAGMLGDWYAFRDLSAESYRGIRVYAQRCRNGRYEIHYLDDAAMLQAAAGREPLPESMVGL